MEFGVWAKGDAARLEGMRVACGQSGRVQVICACDAVKFGAGGAGIYGGDWWSNSSGSVTEMASDGGMGGRRVT